MQQTKLVYLNTLSDFKNHPEVNYVVFLDASLRYDDGYGSSTNPSHSTLNYFKLVGLENEESVKSWIKDNMTARFSVEADYKIFKISPVQVMTEVSISVSLP